jgi:hypothetical protein
MRSNPVPANLSTQSITHSERVKRMTAAKRTIDRLLARPRPPLAKIAALLPLYLPKLEQGQFPSWVGPLSWRDEVFLRTLVAGDFTKMSLKDVREYWSNLPPLLERYKAYTHYPYARPHKAHEHKQLRLRYPREKLPKSPYTEAELGKARTRQTEMRNAYLKTLKCFPFVEWGKYKKRLTQYLLRLVKSLSDKDAARFWEIPPNVKDLASIGIPARQIVGPYTYQRPAEYEPRADRSPSVSDLIVEIIHRDNHGLDPRDQKLCEAIHAYVTTHGNQTPSVQVVLNINRQVEREREAQGKVEAIAIMKKWWEMVYPEVVARWHHAQFTWTAQKLPKGWVLFDGSDTMCEELWYRVNKWNLCLTDQMKYWLEEPPEEWECWYLVLAADRKRGTVVGLDVNRNCPESHWCTGVNNEIDAEAFEFFCDDKWRDPDLRGPTP